jgi:N6-L-threonylcarbamoyladenine synthase
MIILGIETSCDETAISIIKTSQGSLKILENLVFSQIKTHAPFGGVVPKIAGREHLKKIIPLLNKTLKRSKIKLKDIGLIAVTKGPGLAPSLFIGMSAAKTLAYVWQKPIIGLNHVEAHIFSNWLTPISESYKLKVISYKRIFPAVALIVSGGHTQLILVKDLFKYKILGETLDDAAGECFDKTARVLGLGYPGGPAIAEQARQWKPKTNLKFNIKLPRPMIKSRNYDFSFSGLKTAVLYDFKKRSKKERKSKKYLQEMAYEIQQAIIDVLISKTIRAAKEYKAKTIILGGGVAANKELRKQFRQKIEKEKLNYNLQIPSFELCTDNAAMTALLGFYYFKAGKIDDWKNLKIKPDLSLKQI